MPTENLRDFYIKAGLLSPDPVVQRSDAPSVEGEAARVRLQAIDPEFAGINRLAPRGLPTSRALTPEEKQALWDRAFEADPEEAALAYTSVPSTENAKPRAPLTEAEKRQKHWDDAFEADPDAAANAFLSIDKEQPKAEQKSTNKPAGKKEGSKKTTGKKAVPETAEEVAANKPVSKTDASAPTKGFDQLLSGALAGDKNAIAFVNSIGRLNGFDKIQVTKDGIQYQENGEWKNADADDMRTMFDQAVQGIGYWEQLAARQKGRGAPQQQAPRQAIPTDLDPAVLRSLRAKAILQGDVGDLVAYSRMPGQIDETAASAAYRRAATQRALRDAQQQAQPQIEYEYLEDGTTLLVDKNTKRRVGLLDQDDQPMPLSYINNQAQYHEEMDAIIKDVAEDKGQVIRNGTMNPIIKLPNGQSMTYSQYKLAKEGGFKKGHGNVGTASTGGK